MDFISSISFPNEPPISWNISWTFLSSLLGGCNSKATANPPKSDEKNVQEIFNWSEAQCARMDLNKRFLPKPMTTTGWKGTP